MTEHVPGLEEHETAVEVTEAAEERWSARQAKAAWAKTVNPHTGMPFTAAEVAQWQAIGLDNAALAARFIDTHPVMRNGQQCKGGALAFVAMYDYDAATKIATGRLVPDWAK